ncbi:MAG: hypothetical protein EA342_11540, partial [Leptolyngbya sp. LCM1.Bin17]
MPVKRDSLSKQTEYWKLVMKSQDLRCIYSGKVIDPNRFSLDHYLPWSFLAHDQLWNLAPTLPEVNSAKSNNLPSKEYLGKFVELQYLGLIKTYDILEKGKWKKQVEAYTSELKLVNEDDLFSLGELKKSYERTINPLLSLASNQGFMPDWQYISQSNLG